MEEEKRKELVEYKGRELKERDDYILSAELQKEYNAYLEEEINIRAYLEVLLRRKWIIISCLVVSIVAVGIATLMMERLYIATATIEISPEDPKIAPFQEVGESGARKVDFYQTQYQLLQSKTLAKQVIDSFKLDSSQQPELDAEKNKGFIFFLKEKIVNALSAVTGVFVGKKAEPVDPKKAQQAMEEGSIYLLLSKLTVVPDPTSRLAKINFESTNPEFAAKVVNTLVDKYLSWVLERKVNTTKSAGEFLGKQLQQVKTRLEKAEEELGRFAKSMDILALENNQKLSPTYKQFVDLSAALTNAEAERFLKEPMYKGVQSGNYEYLPQVVNDSSLQSLNGNYILLKAQYDNIAVLYGPNYPEIKQIAAQLERMENSIDQRKKSIAETIRKDYEATLFRENNLRKKVEEQKKLVNNLNERSVEYRILEREVDSNKSIYNNILLRLKETEVTSALESTNVQVVDYASTPLAPYKPDVGFYMLIATFAGIMGGVFLAFVFEYFDNTIKDEEEIKKRYALPYLGGVPMADENSLENIERAVYENPRSIISEAFRVIRTSILYSSPEHSPRSLLVTSSQPIEGKTTSASNLALSMIQSGLKIVLVDADLRRPRLHRIFLNNGDGSGYGLSTYLVGKRELHGIISRTDVDGLDIIPAGPIPPNPAELLGSRRMRDLIKSLLEQYDHVIVDGAPVSGFADSRLLSRLVDGVLIVTSLGITQRQALRASIEEIQRVGGRIIGTIVNRLEPGWGKYGYNTYYYYYGNNENSKYRNVKSYRKKKNQLLLKGRSGKRRSNSSFS